MTLHQAMAMALVKMKMGGLQAPFGTSPSNSDEIKLQVDAYLVALKSATKREITEIGLDLTAERFLSGKVSGIDPAKFPSAPEFARAFSDAMDSQFMCLGVPDGPNTVRMIEIRRDTPAEEVRRIIAANTPKALPKPKRGALAGKKAGEAGAAVVRKMSREPDAFTPTDEETEAERQRQVAELMEAEKA